MIDPSPIFRFGLGFGSVILIRSRFGISALFTLALVSLIEHATFTTTPIADPNLIIALLGHGHLLIIQEFGIIGNRPKSRAHSLIGLRSSQVALMLLNNTNNIQRTEFGKSTWYWPII